MRGARLRAGTLESTFAPSPQGWRNTGPRREPLQLRVIFLVFQRHNDENAAPTLPSPLPRRRRASPRSRAAGCWVPRVVVPRHRCPYQHDPSLGVFQGDRREAAPLPGETRTRSGLGRGLWWLPHARPSGRCLFLPGKLRLFGNWQRFGGDRGRDEVCLLNLRGRPMLASAARPARAWSSSAGRARPRASFERTLLIAAASGLLSTPRPVGGQELLCLMLRSVLLTFFPKKWGRDPCPGFGRVGCALSCTFYQLLLDPEQVP